MRDRAHPRRLLAVALAFAAAWALWLAAGASGQGDGARPDRGALTPVLDELTRPAVATAPKAGQADAVSLPRRGPGSLLRAGDRVVVEVTFESGARGAADALRDAGAQVFHVSPRYETDTVAVPPQRLTVLERVPGVQGIGEVLTPMVAKRGGASGGGDLNTCQGAKTSEGDTQLRAATARAQWDIDGAGVEVGLLSDSFARTTSPTSAAGDVATGDLPGPGNPCGRTAPVDVIEEGPADGASDEGRAMAQIVHDLAPGSPLAFATAFTGELSFADNIRALQAAGADVIVDDVTYFSEPFFQDGPISVAVNDVTAAGAVYFSSAGNNNIISGGRNVASFEAPSFRNAGACPAGAPTYATQCMDFDAGAGLDTTYGITVPNGRTLTLDLQWAQPRFGVTTDLDAYLLSGSTLLTYSERVNVAGASGSTDRPYELISWSNTTGSAQSVNLAINRYTGSGGGGFGTPRLKFIFLGNGVPNEYTTSNGTDIVGPTIFGHNGAENAMSTAAVPYNNSGTVEPFSSHGPVTLTHGPVSGTTPASPLPAPTQLAKPDLAATDGGQNTFFGGFDGSNYRFYGTSAAAPHAAAVAALMRQLAPGASVGQIKTAEIGTGRDVGSFPVTAIGGGLVDAVAATASVGGSSTPPDTIIDSGPSGLTRIASATFAFHATEAGAGFECRLDGGSLAPCSSPRRFGGLAEGPHSFAVRAIGAGANTDPTPAARAFFVDTRAPAVAGIRARVNVRKRKARIAWAVTEPRPGSGIASQRCKLDARAFRGCSSPVAYKRLRAGRHRFTLRVTDRAGNATEQSKRLRVKKKRRR